MADAGIVRQHGEGPPRWKLVCPLCAFTSSGWRTKSLAQERRRQHLAEHEGAPPATPPSNAKE